MSSSRPPPRRNRSRVRRASVLALERVREVDVPVAQRRRLVGELLDPEDVGVVGRVGPGALAHDGRPRRGVLLDGEDALGRLLDRHLEPGVQQQRDVGGYDGRTPLGAAGLGPDPHMDRLHTARMTPTRSVDAVALPVAEMPRRLR